MNCGGLQFDPALCGLFQNLDRSWQRSARRCTDPSILSRDRALVPTISCLKPDIVVGPWTGALVLIASHMGGFGDRSRSEELESNP